MHPTSRPSCNPRIRIVPPNANLQNRRNPHCLSSPGLRMDTEHRSEIDDLENAITFPGDPAFEEAFIECNSGLAFSLLQDASIIRPSPLLSPTSSDPFEPFSGNWYPDSRQQSPYPNHIVTRSSEAFDLFPEQGLEESDFSVNSRIPSILAPDGPSSDISSTSGPSESDSLLPQSPSLPRANSSDQMSSFRRSPFPGGGFDFLEHVASPDSAGGLPSPAASSSSSVDPQLISPSSLIDSDLLSPSSPLPYRHSFSGDRSLLFPGACYEWPPPGTARAPASRSSSVLSDVFDDDDDLQNLSFREEFARISLEDGVSDVSSSSVPAYPSSRVVKQEVGTKAMDDANQRKKKHDSIFRCLICPKKFTTSFSMRRHLNSHFGVRYPCSYCSVNFGNPSDRNRHTKKKHNRSGSKRHVSSTATSSNT